ncbi:MAG TPA: ATP-dependent helicase HrpB [Thermoanaerobaculia bacterium]
MRPLPIDDVLPEILGALATNAALVLRAPTGAGKTTRVPPALLDAGLAGGRRVVMLEPRRVAARAAARRMAEERGTPLGEDVGYQIRFERRYGKSTRVLVVTEGVLVQLLQHDPFLEDAGALVFDEFHERNLASDLSLAMARRVQRDARPDLKLVVMSATLDPAPVAAYLGGCPVVESAGRLHPVTVRYLERPDPRRPEQVVAAGVRRLLGETPGDVLVFLPGVGEIRRTANALEPLAAERGLAVMPLYGDLPSEEQDAVLVSGPRRKGVLATNVAETSITIDGVTGVVDSGLVRVLRFDPASGLDRLELTRASRVSAEQRAGRAGRQQPGVCLRLWTEHDDRSLPARDVPEIRRVDLAGPLLELLAWGERDVAAFEWFEAPEPAAVERALALLRVLGAVDESGLTATGRRMASLPVHPRLARLVLAGHDAGVRGRAAMLAALVSERDLVTRSTEGPPEAAHVSSSDLLDRLHALDDFVRAGYGETALGPIHRGRARQVLRAGRDLERLAERALGRQDETEDDDGLLRALLAAYPDRLARRRENGSPRGVMVGGRGVRLADASAVRRHELFLCVDLDARREALVRQASGVEREWLPAESLKATDDVDFDGERGVGRRRTRYLDLVLDEREIAPTPEAASRALATAAADDLDRALDLGRGEVASFLARARSLAEWMPELGLPRFTDAELATLLPVLCAGKRSFAELRRTPLVETLKGVLGYEQLAALERHAPERLEVPSGSRIRLVYEPGRPPVLAARIQELFGLRETPRVAAGRVAVMVHLLAPNGRPQQVTQDLESFWASTYPQVRKELQGRYPKHAWPADPWTATPEKRPRRRT